MEVVKKYFDRFPGDMPERRRWALASIAAIDDGMGKINETLEQLGLAEDTIIFYFGDNGAPLKIERKDDPFSVHGGWNGSDNGPLVGEKGMISDGGIRVPYLVYWKNRIPAQIYKHPVISLDAGATALALAGVETAPGEIDGVNLVPYLTDKKGGEPHNVLYWRFRRGQSAIREGKWKYYYLQNGVQMLFDMESDEHENRNLIQQYPEIAKRLQKKLANFRAEQKRPGFVDVREEETPFYKHYFNVKGQ